LCGKFSDFWTRGDGKGGIAMKQIKLYDSKAIARFLDVTERRVRQLRDEGVIVEHGGSKNLYDRDAATVAYINFLRHGNSNSGEGIDYNAERAKLIRAKRLNEEYDLKVKEGELHSTAEVEIGFTRALTEFKNNLLGMPQVLSPMLAVKKDKAEIFKIIDSYCKEALFKLEKFGEKMWEEAVTDEEVNSGDVQTDI
jgi:phage terminase Nu1 subunit (DNA packaging protein)